MVRVVWVARSVTDVDGELWALVGIVVGAILGGFGQVVADQLRAKQERVAVRREVQQTAYAAFIAHASVAMLAEPLESAEPLHVLTHSSANVQLVAPRATSDAALSLTLSLMLKHGAELKSQLDEDEAEPPTIDDAVTAGMDEFIKLAKRDLGLP